QRPDPRCCRWRRLPGAGGRPRQRGGCAVPQRGSSPARPCLHGDGMTPTTEWKHPPHETRGLIEQRTGPVVKAEQVSAGRNHQLAAILHTSSGTVFIKGVHTSDRRSRRQALEAAVAATVATTSPRLLWYLPHAGGWDPLAFEAVVRAPPPDPVPGTEDLNLLAPTVPALREAPSPPPLVWDRIEQRWAEPADPDEVQLLPGEHLLHPDLRPDNILVSSDRAWIVDWSWPTRGAAWIDPACLTLWLIAQGHSPADAEAWMRTVPVAGKRTPPAPHALITITPPPRSPTAPGEPPPP